MVIRLAFLFCLVAGIARADSLRLIVPDGAPVVGEMIPVTVRGEYTSRIALESLTFPNAADYDWIQLARDQWRDETIDGVSVRVFERRIAVFPRHAGMLRLGPVVHRLTVIGASGARVPLDVTAPAVSFPVAPYPGPPPPLAASALVVKDELSAAPGALRDGETLVRRVTLIADGTLPHLMPVRPPMRAAWLISFTSPEQREMKPTPNGPVTTIVWEWHLRPKTGEPGVLPAVTIPWFDTETRRLRTAEIPAIPFGYASFRDDRSSEERLPAGQVALAVAALAAGAVGGIALAVAGLAARRRADLHRRVGRGLFAIRGRHALRRAAATGDAVALRRAAEIYVDERRALGLPVTGHETAQLDEALYGRSGLAPDFDTNAALAALTRHR
ncbi:BatD family protein [Segnochrobactrum spirostomi]|uniref:Protein BatD n=1 Tax=Segnochrobactrum spirostomi TaxID=2608987 RepID=A0A6A7Y6L4_9HYPH|nr:BatD family protein [Segnochrobactrum spirostomi]MQT14950.1 protein BatD [Segnochrobactrum spirostomi]